MDFSEHQQLFLRTICTYFHENAEWPTYGWLDRVLRKQDKAIDVQVLGDELDRFMFDGPHAPVAITWDPKRATYLSIEALRTCQVEGICPELATDFEAFERVLLLCIERYESDEDNPRVQAANVQARLGLSDRELRVVFQLMLLSGLTAGSSPGNDVIGWYFDVASTIRVYRNATTTTDYFQIRQAEHERYRRAQQAASTIDFSLATLSSPYQYGARSAEGTAEESASLDSSPAEKSPPAIFICYRREDAIAYALGIAHDLKQHFGADAVFLDISGIAPGTDWPVEIENALNGCNALLAVIGPQWLTIAEATSGRRRLDNEADWVRREIADALGRQLRLIPILVHRASMPRKDDLPDEIKALADKQAHEISDTRWDYDIGQLIQELERVPRKQMEASS